MFFSFSLSIEEHQQLQLQHQQQKQNTCKEVIVISDEEGETNVQHEDQPKKQTIRRKLKITTTIEVDPGVDLEIKINVVNKR